MDAVTHNLNEFNGRLRRYATLSRKTPQEVLQKKGGSFAYALAHRLAGIAPGKGTVRQERLAALKAGGGIKIRPGVREQVLSKYRGASDVATGDTGFIRGRKQRFARSLVRKGKRLNLHALMVERELNIRESGRGFLAQSSRYPRTLAGFQNFAKSRFGPYLSRAGFTANDNGAVLTFSWDGTFNRLQGDAASGLSKAKARAAIALALRDEIEDIDKYFADRLRDNARKAGLG